MKVDGPDGAGTECVEPNTVNADIEESDAVPRDEEKEKNSIGEGIKLDNEKLDEIIVEVTVEHEEHAEDTMETRNTEEKTEDEVHLEGDIDASKCNSEEEKAEELRKESCTENNKTLEAGEKGEAEVRNEEKDSLNFENNIEEYAAVENVQNREATSTTDLNVDEALVVSDSGVKEDSMMENEGNQDVTEVKDLLTEFPVVAFNGNEKEENKNDEANIAGEVETIPKRKVVKKIVKRKTIVKQKAVVAKDESKPQMLEMHEPVVEVRTDENVENEENPDGKPKDKVISVRRVRKKKKKKKQQPSEVVATKYETKPEPSERNELAGKEKEANENENMDQKEEAKKSEGKVKKSRKRKRNRRKAANGNADKVTVEEKDKAEPSEKHESSKKVETPGMIFMCSSKTKKDCFHYKIFGLPASKKDMVLQVYEGMRLFLFDFESRMLYGIYKAAGPGGYNIEPKAFKSDFPSQVRFTILNECLPLPEEKFKEAIKDNYFTKNKFNCQLNPDQVEKLCKLFIVTGKKCSKSDARSISEQKKKRGRAEDDADRDRKKKRAQDDADRDRKERRAQDDAKRDSIRRAKDDRRRSSHTRHSLYALSGGNPQRAVVYKREAFVPAALPARPYMALPPPAVPAYTLSYTYGRTSGDDIYRQDAAIERQERGLTYSRLQYLDEGRSNTYPYSLYTEPAVRYDAGYSTSTRQDYYSSIASQDEYLPSSSRTSYYQVPLPPFRRY